MGGKVKSKGNAMGRKVKAKGMAMGGKAKSKGMAMGGKVKSQGMTMASKGVRRGGKRRHKAWGWERKEWAEKKGGQGQGGAKEKQK